MKLPSKSSWNFMNFHQPHLCHLNISHFHENSWSFLNYWAIFFIIFHELSWRFMNFFSWVSTGISSYNVSIPVLNKKWRQQFMINSPASCSILIRVHIQPHNWHSSIVRSCPRVVEIKMQFTLQLYLYALSHFNHQNYWTLHRMHIVRCNVGSTIVGVWLINSLPDSVQSIKAFMLNGRLSGKYDGELWEDCVWCGIQKIDISTGSAKYTHSTR